MSFGPSLWPLTQCSGGILQPLQPDRTKGQRSKFKKHPTNAHSTRHGNLCVSKFVQACVHVYVRVYVRVRVCMCVRVCVLVCMFLHEFAMACLGLTKFHYFA